MINSEKDYETGQAEQRSEWNEKQKGESDKEVRDRGERENEG